jgi:glycerophosphoryl diester phosphodiesterase
MSTPVSIHWPYPCWIAHRGAGRLAPENTMAAFHVGVEHGFRMFECDVKLSADSEPFLLHDAELDRTTNGQGAASVQRWDALSRLDAGSWHSPAFAGEPLLRLEALARWVQAQSMFVNLEIKPSPGEEERTGRIVAQQVNKLWDRNNVKPLLSSFSVDALNAVKEAQADLPRALLLDRWVKDAVQQAKALGCVALVVQESHLDESRIEEGHAASLKMLTYTVNDPERASTLWLSGLDGLITDRVDLFEPQARLGTNPGQLLAEVSAIADA